ncbi:hypothetical protein D9M68_936890 [compost metagenome]
MPLLQVVERRLQAFGVAPVAVGEHQAHLLGQHVRHPTVEAENTEMLLALPEELQRAARRLLQVLQSREA